MSDNLHETRSIKKFRSFLSFVLFVLVTVLSLSICTNSYFANSSNIEKHFVSYNYISSFREDIVQYSSDMFIKDGLSDENLDDVITYDLVKELTNSYYRSQFETNSSFTADSVANNVESIIAPISSELKLQLDNSSYKYNKEKADELTENIGNYINERISLAGTNYIQTAVNIAKIVSLVVSIVMAVFVAVLCLIIYFLGTVRYRSVRAISFSFTSAGILSLIISLIVYIISKVKIIDIFPMYLREAVMDYINACIGVVAISGATLLLISFVIICVVWKLKRTTQD